MEVDAKNTEDLFPIKTRIKKQDATERSADSARGKQTPEHTYMIQSQASSDHGQM